MGPLNLPCVLTTALVVVLGSTAWPVPDDLPDNRFGGKRWVVLVAGSTGWSNYRHQADICHAYQIVKRNGIPEQNVITFLVDDIANNSRNPNPGTVINKPGGPDVYGGVVIDYRGEDVNVENFLNVIVGNKTAVKSVGTGKVVETGPFDTIFVNFVDHGGPGFLGFPDDLLFADRLIDALNVVQTNGFHTKILLYIEACHAGSMFDGLLGEDSNVLAVTASGPRESSWGCYCGKISGYYHTCLGDLFSVTWMEGLDETTVDSPEAAQTVFRNFDKTRTNVTKSNVMVYGAYNVGRQRLSRFIGKTPDNDRPDAVGDRRMMLSNRDAELGSIRHRLSSSSEGLSEQKARELRDKIRANQKMRTVVDGVFGDIYGEIGRRRPDVRVDETDEYGRIPADAFPCYSTIVNRISANCFSLPRNPYALDKVADFAKMCTVDKRIDGLAIGVIDSVCSDVPGDIEDVY